jgi:hypothetical protein
MPPLHLPPTEDLVLPAMKPLRISGSSDPKVLLLEFETTTQGHGPLFPGQIGRATISVPVTTIDTAGLLRSLLILRERGVIPFVPETPVPDKLN